MITPDISSLVAHWEAIGGRSRVPWRFDVEPSAFVDVLPRSLVIEVPSGLVRVSGGAIRHWAPGGSHVMDRFSVGAPRDVVCAALSAIADQQSRGLAITFASGVSNCCLVLLPLAIAPGLVSRALAAVGGAIPEIEKAIPDVTVSALRVPRRFRVIDGGRR